LGTPLIVQHHERNIAGALIFQKVANFPKKLITVLSFFYEAIFLITGHFIKVFFFFTYGVQPMKMNHPHFVSVCEKV